jgi:hypothetical protein
VEPSRRSARDNGLRCSAYAAIGDYDPRVADAILEELRTVGIAAYVSPTPGTTGGYLETRPPAGLTDRLFADSLKVDQAKTVADQEHSPESPAPAGSSPVDAPGSAGGDDLDIDAAWQQLLVSLQAPSTSATPTWPSSEDLPATPVHSFESLPPLEAPAPTPEDEHFVPPPPPPLPTLQRVTVVAWLAILGGIALLVFNIDGGSLSWVGILAILGGAFSLVWHVKQGPPTDSGWDDGAIV